ncbi:MAG: hypothetical protein F9K30_21295 [Dechloromonas sp.]|nr:MAG: hypothetical protein F9K30_21295 [Dechloromonas sp.]
MKPNGPTVSEKQYKYLLIPIAIVPALMAALGSEAGFVGGILIAPIFLWLTRGKQEDAYLSRFVLLCIVGISISLTYYIIFSDVAHSWPPG